MERSAETAMSAVGEWVGRFAAPTIRLGVTGLSRAGKTVFITALVRNLLGPRRMPFFSVAAEGRINAAYLQPQPDDHLPRFAYERHVAALTQDPPRWPDSTSRISQLRVTLDIEPKSMWTRIAGLNRVHIDIVDYPGEWLLDLGLIDLSFAEWSEMALRRIDRAGHDAIAAPFRAALAQTPAEEQFDEVKAQAVADTFAAYLRAAREQPPGLATLGPGRFLMPGELEGSPMLTFSPLPISREAAPGSFHAEFERRYRAYKDRVVQPFFRDHFSKLDRQIVLVDALAALNGGRRALEDLRDALEAALHAFRPGQSSWLGRLVGDRRVEKVLFAATKADHLPQVSHSRLEDVLRLMIERAHVRAQGAGADVGVLATAAIRATQETRATVDGEDLACIKGTPLAGETVGETMFDGHRPAAVFPGDLPQDPAAALAAAEADAFELVHFVRFRPPPLDDPTQAVAPKPWPHIRLDRALEFLLSDRLP